MSLVEGGWGVRGGRGRETGVGDWVTSERGGRGSGEGGRVGGI